MKIRLDKNKNFINELNKQITKEYNEFLKKIYEIQFNKTIKE